MLTRIAGGDEVRQRAAAFDELAYSLSQLLHGEQAALQLCGQLINVCDDLDAKAYAASQAADEARHVEALSKFLCRKLGRVYPVSPVMKVLLDRLLSQPTAERKLIGFQCLFEGVALGIFEMLRSGSSNPLLGSMIHRIARDEARHAAFGVLCARRAVGRASPEDREELEDFAFSILEALNANQRLDMLRALGPEYGVDPWRGVRLTLAMPGFVERNAALYMRAVLPNLERIGLLTARTRPGYERLGMWLVPTRRPDAAGGLPGART